MQVRQTPSGNRKTLPRHISVCCVAPRSEYFGNCLNRDSPNIAYVISDSGFQFGQNGIQFALTLGGDRPISEQMYPVFKGGRRHANGPDVNDYIKQAEARYSVSLTRLSGFCRSRMVWYPRLRQCD
jgi:hypothetical protein